MAKIFSGTKFISRLLKFYTWNFPINKGKARLVRYLHKTIIEDSPVQEGKLLTGSRMILDLDSYVERRIYYLGFYRPWVFPVFKELVTNKKGFVDVGANVGPYTLAAADLMNSDGKIFSFEPDPDCFEKLMTNIQINSLSCVTTENLAISEKVGEVIFHKRNSRDDNQGQGSLAKQKFHHKNLIVTSTTLDVYFNEVNTPLDVLKIDTQGSEMRVLLGARCTISRCRPDVILRCHEEKLNLLNDSSVAIQHFFKDLDYHLFKLVNGKEKLLPIHQIEPESDATFVFYSK